MTEYNEYSEDISSCEEPAAYLERQGIEAEKDGGEQDIVTPFDPKKVEIAVEQITIYGLAARIEDDAIDLMPEFQRQSNLWSNTKMSQLIESILIRLPLPAMYMDVANDDKWVVVDGLQRLSTIKKFMVDKKLVLKGMEFLKELEGKSFDELDRMFQRRIYETNITVFKIKKGTPKKVLTSLFHRINTGGTKLTAQEIRHALNQGQVTEFLKRISEEDWFRECIQVSPKRMLNKELILRFMAFYNNGYENYKPSLQQFLDDEMESLNEQATADELALLEDKFKKTLELSKNIFNNKMFSKALIHPERKVTLNRSLFETTTVNLALLSDDEQRILKNSPVGFLSDYKELLNNSDFNSAITEKTNNKDNVKYRHKEMQKIITKYTRHAY
ncbi:DUF262 domain-containing protein [Puteibacter caeruleilacunae]|nr:DUF262 domain-containing protein [Puteibacter caeruleilacunae]